MTLRAGAAAAVVTPDVPCMLAGFGARSGPAVDVHDDLQVRALFATDGVVGVCLVVCDLLALGAAEAEHVRTQVARVLDIPRHNVLTSCIHTHSGPNAVSVGDRVGWTTPPGYLDVLAAGACDAAEAARRAARPAALHHGRDPLPAGLAVNRRGYDEPQWYSMLDVRGEDGARIAVVANVAIHPVMLGPECHSVSTDWVGPFRDATEASAGGTCIVLPGPLGDINPPDAQSPPGGAERFAETAEFGRLVAQRCAPLLDRVRPAGDTLAVVPSRTVEVPVATTLLTTVEPLGDSTDVELSEWRLGDVQLVSIPGEAMSGFAREVVQARGDRLLLANLAPSWHGYLPLPYHDTGYEESMSLGEGAVAAILAAVCAGPAAR